MIGAAKAWLLIGVSVAIVTAVTLYVIRAEKAVGMRDALEAALQEAEDDIDEREVTITGLNQDIVVLRGSRDTVNERLKTMIDENNAEVEAEVARRLAAEADRNKAKEALRIALDTISTESARDETFKTWLEQPASNVAWDRLRDAAE